MPLELVGHVATLSTMAQQADTLVEAVARLLCRRLQFAAAVLVADSGEGHPLVGAAPTNGELVQRALRQSQPAYAGRTTDSRTVALVVDEAACSVLQLVRAQTAPAIDAGDRTVLATIGRQVRSATAVLRQRRQGEEDARRAELLLEISHQIAAQHDLGSVLDKLLGSALELFGAERGAVFRRLPDGGFTTDAERNLGEGLIQAVESATSLPLVSLSHSTGRMVSVTGYVHDPRSEPLRAHFQKAGVDTVSVAPLVREGEWLGALALCHDRPYEWRRRDQVLFEQLAAQGAAALHNARMLSQTQTWAAQLQSIQQLGVMLNRLDDPRAIGRAIADELSRLIDFHNVRVYRVEGEDVVPVAWRGRIGEYADEDIDQLRLKVGEGITGWVARHGEVVNLADAAKDSRAETIPGTEDDLDESMLLAPMLHEETVIGVLVLSKLGLGQFSPDDQRLLEIFAAIAAQAMASAEATERLRQQSEALARQLHSQRELLRVTESILSTLDRQALLDEIADRLASLIPVDNIFVELYDPATGALRPIFARGSHAQHFLATSSDDRRGISGHVVRSGEPIFVHDQLSEPRLLHFAGVGPLPGTLIALPLRARDNTLGVLTIERLGEAATFTDEDYELAKLFGGHVSIALRNADLHHAVEVQAQTDALTGLLNHGALIRRLDEATTNGLAFGLLMIDLDNFKGYNDRFGHQAGDSLLSHLAKALVGACREGDEVYRYGGDEFAILLPHASPRGTRAVAAKVRTAIAHASPSSRSAHGVTASIGVAAHPDNGSTAEHVLLSADRACFVAKRSGRDRIATAAEGLALAGEFLPPPPTPVDAPEAAYSAA